MSLQELVAVEICISSPDARTKPIAGAATCDLPAPNQSLKSACCNAYAPAFGLQR